MHVSKLNSTFYIYFNKNIVFFQETSVTFQTIKMDALCIVSNPKVEHVHISPGGCNFVAQTDNRIQLEFSSGTVENEDSLRFHVCMQVFINSLISRMFATLFFIIISFLKVCK